MAASSNNNNVINWEEALQQCGDDEEFLRELLADLRSETQTQVANIASTIQNPQEAPYHRIMRSAHVIKGAAANLMCGELRQTSLQLEQAASAAHDATSDGAQPPANLQAAVQTEYGNLQKATQNFVAYLQSIGV